MGEAKGRPTSTSGKYGGGGDHTLLWDRGLAGSWRKSPWDTREESRRRTKTKTQRELPKEPRRRAAMIVIYSVYRDYITNQAQRLKVVCQPRHRSCSPISGGRVPKQTSASWTTDASCCLGVAPFTRFMVRPRSSTVCHNSRRHYISHPIHLSDILFLTHTHRHHSKLALSRLPYKPHATLSRGIFKIKRVSCEPWYESVDCFPLSHNMFAV